MSITRWLLLLMLLPVAVSCQSDVGVAVARNGSPVTFTRSGVEEKLTKLKFPMTRAELAGHIPAVGLEKEPRVLLDSAMPRTRGTEYCRLGDGLLLVMPVDYKHVASQRPYAGGAPAAPSGQGGGISVLEVRTDAGDVVKGAALAVNRGATCTNCTTAQATRMLLRGL